MGAATEVLQGGREAALTSLDLLAEIGEWEKEPGQEPASAIRGDAEHGGHWFNGRPACPRRQGMLLLDRNSGEIAPTSCDAQFCSFCLRRHVREMPPIIAHGEPERALTLTLLPDDWQPARAQVRDFWRRLRATGYPMQAAWTTERTKSGLRHLHAATWGSYVPQDLLQRMWGNRLVDIRAIRGEGGQEGWGRYLGKMADGRSWPTYLAKSAAEHVADNGGRIVHLTRGYLRGETMTQVRAKLRAHDEEDRDWQVVRVEELELLGVEALRRSARRAKRGT